MSALLPLLKSIPIGRRDINDDKDHGLLMIYALTLELGEILVQEKILLGYIYQGQAPTSRDMDSA